MKYLPKSRYKGNLNSQPGEFVYKSTKLPYNGVYFKTWDERYFTGEKPGIGVLELMRVFDEGSDENTLTSLNNTLRPLTTYDYIRNSKPEQLLKATRIIPTHYPKPTVTDYRNKNLIRCFCRNINNSMVKEISKDVYTSIRNKEPKYYYPDYIISQIEWKIGQTQGEIEKAVLVQQNVDSIKKLEKDLEIRILFLDPNQFLL